MINSNSFKNKIYYTILLTSQHFRSSVKLVIIHKYLFIVHKYYLYINIYLYYYIINNIHNIFK